MTDVDVCFIVPTFNRPALLNETLNAALHSEASLHFTIIVINNGTPLSAAWRGRLSELGPPIEIIESGNNLGPAGAISLGIRRRLESTFTEQSWVMLLDDDDPPPTTAVCDLLLNVVESTDGLRVDGVAMGGARYDAARGRVLRLSDEQLGSAVVEVDWFAGNQFPMYRVCALRAADLELLPHLFFGFEELALGLALRRAGSRLIVSGPLVRRRRLEHERTGLRRSQLRRHMPSWRFYYSTRNLILIARHFGTQRRAVPATALRSFAASLLVRGRTPRQRTMGMLGVLHGLAGVRGRVVAPVAKHSGQSSPALSDLSDC